MMVHEKKSFFSKLIENINGKKDGKEKGAGSSNWQVFEEIKRHS